MLKLTLSMLVWAWRRLRSPSFRLSSVPPGFIVLAGVVLVLCALILVWQPFKRRLPVDAMTVSECGAALSDARSGVLQRESNRQREIMRAADMERRRLESERDKAQQASAMLSARLALIENEKAATSKPDVCLPIDVVRAWNKGGQ